MKTLIFFFAFVSGFVRASVMASNVVADVSSYTGQVVTVSGKVDCVKSDSLSSSSYVVVMQGLNVRVFFNPNEKVFAKNGRLQRSTFDNIHKPSVGAFGVYSGMVKRDGSKVFLITEKKD
ncbi:MAG: hypothetical protein WCP12_17900 [bacterium]